MGLAAPKNRIKISHDPNNTKWTNDTQSFGHKIMTSQGWQPGEHLGVKDAAHAELHTEANFSHIRVSIKDDNLGLGAKIGSGVGAGECTGLDAFQNLLGRLNGRDEDEIEKEQKSREELKRAIYAEQRWGSIRFVKGGLLIGDKIQPLIDAEKERVRRLEEGSLSDSSSEEESEDETPIVEDKTKKSKKRKLEDAEETVPEVVAVKIKKSKKRKLEKDRHAEVVVAKVKKSKKTSEASDDEVATALKEIKLSKKKSKKDRESKADSEDTQDEEERSKQRKEEKRDRKREKREKKEKAKSLEGESRSKSKRDKKKSKEGESSESSRAATKESTPMIADSSGRSTPMMQGRHAVRARNIAQKRLASMDVAALNQIFMIKSQT